MTDTAPIIHINGWSGCGKLTIARALAHLIGGRLLDNHTLLNPGLALFDRGTPNNRALRQAVRDLVFSAAVRLPPTTPLILTDAFSDDPYETALFEDVIALARSRHAPLLRVNLAISEQENIRRLTRPERAANHKLTDPAILRQHRADHDLLGADDPDVHLIDVTALSAQDAARTIATRLVPQLLSTD